jgi:hypothetical protein
MSSSSPVVCYYFVAAPRGPTLMIHKEASVAERLREHSKWAVLNETLERLESAPFYRETSGRPFVTVSYAQSVDGSVASAEGSSLALSSSESLALTHGLRAAHQAILEARCANAVLTCWVTGRRPHFLRAPIRPQPSALRRLKISE